MCVMFGGIADASRNKKQEEIKRNELAKKTMVRRSEHQNQENKTSHTVTPQFRETIKRHLIRKHEHHLCLVLTHT